MVDLGPLAYNFFDIFFCEIWYWTVNFIIYSIGSLIPARIARQNQHGARKRPQRKPCLTGGKKHGYEF